MVSQADKYFKLKYALFLALALALLVLFQQYIDHIINGYEFEFSWFVVSVRNMFTYFIWALISPVLFRIINKQLLTTSILQIVIKQFLLSIIIAALHRIVVVQLFDIAYYFQSGYFRFFFSASNQVQLGAGFFSSIIQYWIIVGLLMSVAYYSKFIEKKKELNVAQLSALKMQLQPHFLFNTLNSIASLIDLDRKKAQKMLSQLGFLLREILEHDDKEFIPLRDELAYVKTYFAIEQTRFQDRMIITNKVDQRLLDAEIPFLLLQPLIENAVKHGISTCINEGEIKMDIEAQGANIEINILNDFGKSNTNRQGYGIGISNIQNRLIKLYGSNFEFVYGVNDSNKYFSKIVIPYTKLSLSND